MGAARLAWLIALAALLPAAAPATSSAQAVGEVAAPARAVEVRYGEWVDPARGGRVVPYKMYVPAGDGPFPVIIHSHGLGGSREASAYILEAVAEAGFLAVALQHAGSDSGLLEGLAGQDGLVAAGRRGMNPQAAQARYGDVPFALDQIAREAQAGRPLAGKADLTRVGMSGHSYGALSTLVAVGQRTLGGSGGAPAGASFAEPRIKAAIAYSPNKPRGDHPVAAFAKVRTPMLHFTGTEDVTPFDLERSPFERTAPYQAIEGADQFLVILRGGDHAVFGGRRAATGRLKPTDPGHMALVKAETVRFWRAYLGADAKAAAELCTLPARAAAQGEGFVKAKRCGPPTPIAPLDGATHDKRKP